jgi:hypothetical protein
VERTFGWLMCYRRLARDYERTTANAEAMIYWATVIIMTRRLTRYENGQPPIEPWAGERPRPSEQPALSTGSKHLPRVDQVAEDKKPRVCRSSRGADPSHVK